MIGLGSNRLTVCRRGGMSVTQAGRGGMEWLAGYREPSWASPYSAQATAALKAQFPTQWPTIRDYGIAHPEIVAYMNAYAPEDAKIAYSLVPLDKWRYLVITNDSSRDSYKNGVNLPYKLNEITRLEMDGYFASGNNYMLFTGLSGNNPASPWLGTAGTSGFSNISRTNFDSPNVDGATKVATFTCTSTSLAHMFSWSDWNWNLITKARALRIYNGDTMLMNLIPYEEDGTVYLLDLLEGRKLTQSMVTPFTTELQTPAS